ncbi:MAG: hypothetical protein GY929_21940 [Actinomycetia bacterium]|nr:hypothetical protein [Actinomycetes bacterium]
MSTPHPEGAALRAVLARITPSHLLTAAAALAAFVLVLGLLHQQGRTQAILVAAADLPAGTRLGPGSVRVVELPADIELSQLVPADPGLDDAIVGRSVRAGAPLRWSDLETVDEGPVAQRLSIPVEPERAVGGSLRLLDRVDVISVTDGGAAVVASGLRVVDLPVIDPSPFASSTGPWFVTVEVDGGQALAVAVAIDGGSIQLARSASPTGDDA